MARENWGHRGSCQGGRGIGKQLVRTIHLGQRILSRQHPLYETERESGVRSGLKV